jgi:hypothetical protein
MSFTTNVFIKCPYCGTEQGKAVEIPGQFARAQLIWCDVEEGGCDHCFVVTPLVQVTATVDALESERRAYEEQKRAQEAGE